MGEGNRVLLGLKLFYVWAGNAIDTFSFTSGGLMSVHCADQILGLFLGTSSLLSGTDILLLLLLASTQS